MPCLFIVYKDPHSESSHGLKFLVFFAEHLSDVLGILALVETQRWDALFASPECVYQNAWFQVGTSISLFNRRTGLPW